MALIRVSDSSWTATPTNSSSTEPCGTASFRSFHAAWSTSPTSVAANRGSPPGTSWCGDLLPFPRQLGTHMKFAPARIGHSRPARSFPADNLERALRLRELLAEFHLLKVNLKTINAWGAQTVAAVAANIADANVPNWLYVSWQSFRDVDPQ
jgi:hypothetical protein